MQKTINIAGVVVEGCFAKGADVLSANETINTKTAATCHRCDATAAWQTRYSTGEVGRSQLSVSPPRTSPEDEGL